MDPIKYAIKQSAVSLLAGAIICFIIFSFLAEPVTTFLKFNFDILITVGSTALINEILQVLIMKKSANKKDELLLDEVSLHTAYAFIPKTYLVLLLYS